MFSAGFTALYFAFSFLRYFIAHTMIPILVTNMIATTSPIVVYFTMVPSSRKQSNQDPSPNVLVSLRLSSTVVLYPVEVLFASTTRRESSLPWALRLQTALSTNAEPCCNFTQYSSPDVCSTLYHASCVAVLRLYSTLLSNPFTTDSSTLWPHMVCMSTGCLVAPWQRSTSREYPASFSPEYSHWIYCIGSLVFALVVQLHVILSMSSVVVLYPVEVLFVSTTRPE